MANNAPGEGRSIFELDLKPAKHALGGTWKTFELASAVTQQSTTRGTALSTKYMLLPVAWAKAAMDAAKENMRFVETCKQELMKEGQSTYVIPKRTKYMADGDWEASAEEYTTANTEMLWTDITTPDGVEFTPTEYNYGVAITDKNVRTNALNIVQFCREELQYKLENHQDNLVRNALLGVSNSVEATVTTAAGPVAMSNSVNGATNLMGGDATMADLSLVDGDILTTELMKKAVRHMTSDKGYYWSNTTTHTPSAVTKNAWEPTASEPLVWYIAPENRTQLQDDSQFMSAAEYGSDKVLLKGEIGEFIGTKIICTTKVTKFVANDYIWMDGTINPTVNCSGRQVSLQKSGKAMGLVYGAKPTIEVFREPSYRQVRMCLNMAAQAKPIYDDAIVKICVSDV
ncbi:MAG: hypothetical protein WC444_06155 [Candidatus Paceibacterota bacterium]